MQILSKFSFLRPGLVLALAVPMALAACGDDDDAAPADSGTGNTDGGGDDDDGGTNPTDSGMPGDDGGGDPGNCGRYCTAVTSACTGANLQYADMADCMSYCMEANWTLGTEGEQSNNTLECRIYHAGVAADQPDVHCPHAGPTGADVCGSVGFRTDASTAYTRVDRMGMPAVSTALIGSAMKNAYNDADPADDADGTFVGELVTNLTAIHTALDDDLTGAGLSPCSMTETVSDLPQCVGQEVAAGVPVAALVLPDTLQINPAADAGFPNGRRLQDPVIDVTLAVILLELGASCGGGTCTPATLAGLPLNPGANEETFLTTFPYLAPAHTP